MPPRLLIQRASSSGMSTDLTKAGRVLRSARERLDTAMQAAEKAAVEAYEAGAPETEISRQLGVNRMTVRRWLGKL